MTTQPRTAPLAMGRFGPKPLEPIVRAFALGFLTTTGPRLLGCVRLLRRKDLTAKEKWKRVFSIIRKGFGWNKFPAFTALLAASATVIPDLLEKLVVVLRGGTTHRDPALRSRRQGQGAGCSLVFASVFLASWLFWPVLNSKPPPPLRGASTNTILTTDSTSPPPENTTADNAPSPPSDQQKDNNGIKQSSLGPEDLSGRTLDLTLFSAARALDILCCIAWHRLTHTHTRKPNRLLSSLPDLATASTFASLSGLIMWAWFYTPDRLPASYRRWITSAAQVDMRLIEALRWRRQGKWSYGKPTPTPPRLDDMAESLGLEREKGDHMKTIPFPCEIVHMRHGGDNCELHFCWRFWNGFKFAFAMYFPLQAVMQLRKGKIPSVNAMKHMLKTAGRSSAFLGMFIAVFYYSVCLVRTRLGPALFSYETVKPDVWDGGACVGLGCALCGWSVLLESARKRIELALFVAPRGLAVVLPRRYENRYRWRERVVFAGSLGVLMGAARRRPEMVRGMLGRVLGGVLK